MYTEKKCSNKEKHSIIGNMKQRWLHYQYYGSRATADRAAMFNQKQSETYTIYQNITYLLLDPDKLIL